MEEIIALTVPKGTAGSLNSLLEPVLEAVKRMRPAGALKAGQGLAPPRFDTIAAARGCAGRLTAGVDALSPAALNLISQRAGLGSTHRIEGRERLVLPETSAPERAVVAAGSVSLRLTSCTVDRVADKVVLSG